MGDPIWSFVHSVGKEAGGLVFGVEVIPGRLCEIGYPPGVESIPEGLIVEGCAQSAGLSIHLAQSGFHALPILARVNRARFLKRLPLGEGLTVAPKEMQRSESGAIFECLVFGEGSKGPVAEIELLLGFLPFGEMEDGGVEAKARLDAFVRGLGVVL